MMHCTQRKTFLIHGKIERNVNQKSGTFHLIWKHPNRLCTKGTKIGFFWEQKSAVYKAKGKLQMQPHIPFNLTRYKNPISMCAGNQVKEASRNLTFKLLTLDETVFYQYTLNRKYISIKKNNKTRE